MTTATYAGSMTIRNINILRSNWKYVLEKNKNKLFVNIIICYYYVAIPIYIV